MKDIKDRWHEFTISCEILGTNANQIAKDLKVSRTSVEYAARGVMKSPRIRKKITETIKEAKELIPFEYPDEGLKEAG